MPVYTYRREDGTTFDIRQNFSDAPLEVDPNSGQKVQRVIQASGIIFKGSGFYVTDNRGAARPPASSSDSTSASSSNGSSTTSTTSTSTPAASTAAD